MSRLAEEPDIINLANVLGLDDAADPMLAILDSCRKRIDRWATEAGGITSIDRLERLVARKLQIVFEEIRTEEDFDRIKAKYATGKWDGIFASMRMRFEDEKNPTYGALVCRKNVDDDAPDRYVAVIDCRGDKFFRRFFTRWHEIAHRLTTHADLDEPVFRSEHDPVEKMMDEIAAHVGFYEPIFVPAFRAAFEGKLLLTFDTVEAIISGSFPTASFQATLFVCARRLTTPVVYLEATLAHKKEVKRRLQTPSLFGDEPPPGELRAVKVIPNTAARQERFSIPTMMRVPAESVIYRLFGADPQTDGDGAENLSQWKSNGKTLERRAVVVEGRKVSDRVIAIVQPVEALNENRARIQGQPLFSDGEERPA